jgi:hypothetical protein
MGCGTVTVFVASYLFPLTLVQNYSELMEILPAISKSTNGVSWEKSDIPFLMLKDSWPEDHWSSGGSILNLVMYALPLYPSCGTLTWH